MNGWVDLHCHYVPAVDDGVKSFEEGVELCRGLRSIGFSRVVATPHIRTAMFPNQRKGLTERFEAFVTAAAQLDGMPQTGLGAEHFFDDVFWQLLSEGQAIPYPGDKAALVEFPRRQIPLRVEHRFFDMQIRGLRPVVAHPERYQPLFSKTDPLDPLLDAGAVALLDLMSLTGKYGRKPKKAAERMLEEGTYYAACSDSHKPSDVPIVAEAIERLRKLVGPEETEELLGENPRRILEGTVQL